MPVMKRRVGDWESEEGRKFLESRSPLNFVDKIKKPLLIGQGANDPRVKQAEADQIVDPALTAAVMRRWGGPARRIAPRPGEGDDPMAHVIAGDALSPGQTQPLVQATLDWLRTL